MAEKKVLRQRLLTKRKACSLERLAQWNQQIALHLQAHPWYQAANVLYAYRSFRHEISLDRLWDDNPFKQWAFPRCEGKQMIWHRWSGQKASEFNFSRYGIEEPFSDWPIAAPPDLILVPTVACDRRGYRLGYGGGFYDRMLVKLDSAQTKTIGILPEILLQEELPIDSWDQPLDAICTEKGVVLCR